MEGWVGLAAREEVERSISPSRGIEPWPLAWWHNSLPTMLQPLSSWEPQYIIISTGKLDPPRHLRMRPELFQAISLIPSSSCSTLLVPPKKLVRPCSFRRYPSKSIFGMQRVSPTHVQTSRKRFASQCLNQGIRWIVDFWNTRTKKKYKHWENQNSKSKKVPRIFRLDLAD